jgi:hypothetical protein
MEQPGHLSRPAELQTALKRGHGGGEVALIEREAAEAEEGDEQRVVVHAQIAADRADDDLPELRPTRICTSTPCERPRSA